MKLLVDTSVWSLALRRKKSESLNGEEQELKAQLVQAIQDGRIAMLGLLRQELLSGIKDEAQFERVRAALTSYLDEAIHTADYEYAARAYNECRKQGVQAGTVDILLCAVAVRRGWKVLSSDSGLNRCVTLISKFYERTRAIER